MQKKKKKEEEEEEEEEKLIAMSKAVFHCLNHVLRPIFEIVHLAPECLPPGRSIFVLDVILSVGGVRGHIHRRIGRGGYELRNCACKCAC